MPRQRALLSFLNFRFINRWTKGWGEGCGLGMGSGLLPQPPLLGFLVLQRIVSVVLCG